MTKHNARTLISGALATALLATTAGSVAVAQDTTLTYMTSQGWALPAHLELAEQFEEQTGIAVDVQIVPADQYHSVLMARLNSGEGPDIYGSQSGVSELLALNVDRNAVDLSDQPWVDRLDPLVAQHATVNDRLVGLTFWDPLGLVWAVNYNKAIFEAHDLSVPTSYAEFKAICDTLLENDVQPIFEPVSAGWHHVLWFLEIGPVYEQATPGLAAALNANEATFAGNELMLTVLRQMKELFDDGCMGPTALADDWANGPQVLSQGEAAMAVAPLAYIGQVMRDFPEATEDDLGVFVIPLGDNQIMNVNPAGPTMIIYSGSPRIEEAKQYLNFLAQPENVQYFLDNAPEALTMPFEGVETKFNDWQQAFMDQYADSRGTVYQIAVNYVGGQWMDIGRDITAMFVGAMSAEDVLTNIDRRRAEVAQQTQDPAWQ